MEYSHSVVSALFLQEDLSSSSQLLLVGISSLSAGFSQRSFNLQDHQRHVFHHFCPSIFSSTRPRVILLFSHWCFCFNRLWHQLITGNIWIKVQPAERSCERSTRRSGTQEHWTQRHTSGLMLILFIFQDAQMFHVTGWEGLHTESAMSFTEKSVSWSLRPEETRSPSVFWFQAVI